MALSVNYRGCALIIGNEFKGQGDAERRGCAKDLVMMDELFTRLDFKVIIKKNLNADDMKTALREAASAAENIYSDCFVFVLSTHGEEVRDNTATGMSSAADVWKHAVLGENLVRSLGRIYVEEIVDMFSDDNAPGLKNKQKFFFLQACRSRGSSNRLISISNPKFDQGYPIKVKLSLLQRVKAVIKFRRKKERKHWIYDDLDDLRDNDDQTDDANSEGDDGGDLTEEYSEDLEVSEEETEEEDASRESVEEDAGGSNAGATLPAAPFDVVPISCPNDFLIMYPVMPGKSAFRRPSGSYLLRCLHDGKNLCKLLKGNNILQYLTSVSQDMAKYDFLPDLIMKGKPQTKKEEKLRGLIVSNIKALSKNKILLADVLGQDHLKNEDETVVEEYLKNNLDTFTKKEMRAILRRILPFKMSACVVHRLRKNVCLSPVSLTSPMAKAKKRYEKKTGRK